MKYETYERIIGVIQSISSAESCCNQMVSVMTENGEVNFHVSMKTIIVDQVRLRRGMRVAVYYDTTLPAPAIYPPQYHAELITVLRQSQDVMLSYFDDSLLAEDGSLQLNIGPSTRMFTINGQRFTCNPGGNDLLVYYSAMTRSNPPQTTPQRILVLCAK